MPKRINVFKRSRDSLANLPTPWCFLVHYDKFYGFALSVTHKRPSKSVALLDPRGTVLGLRKNLELVPFTNTSPSESVHTALEPQKMGLVGRENAAAT